MIRSLLAAVLMAAMTHAAAAADIAAQVTAYRRAHGLTAVRMDGALVALARQQAAAMAAKETVSHGAGGDFRLRVAGLHRRLVAENIAAGFLTFPEVLAQWDASAGHRENLLMVGARRIGVAAVSKPSSPYRRFWAMIISD
ncbi:MULTISPECIES: CAP domain-containing protein [unclassified Bradyrhizobium]|uniref:CAP domain-containing protein n=1 Tax=unclassified Bradyrhizobium TaxID=2631580 RepID=UPI0032E37A1A